LAIANHTHIVVTTATNTNTRWSTNVSSII
jgi:hypothetical protein